MARDIILNNSTRKTSLEKEYLRKHRKMVSK